MLSNKWLRLGLSALTISTLAVSQGFAAERAQGYAVELRAGPNTGTTTFIREPTSNLTGVRAARVPAKILVTYVGFSPAAKEAFQRAVNMWALQISSPVAITVRAEFRPLGTGVLGSAGPSSVWANFPNAPMKNTWYGQAAASKRAGKRLGGTSPDVIAQFSSVFPNWHFGSTAAPANKYDFTTVVAHELGHGLGFFGLGRIDGGVGRMRLNNLISVYDFYTELGNNVPLRSFQEGSAQLGSALRSNNVFFDSPQVRNQNGGKPARVFAPGGFLPGSSYSHLDETAFPKGSPNSLMTPFLSQGETIRSPGKIGRAVMTNVGW